MAQKCFQILMEKKGKHKKGSPKIDWEIIDLIKQLLNENPLWGIPRIHGELKKLGFGISQSTVQRYVSKKVEGGTGQRWKTFLKNHSKENCINRLSYNSKD